MPSRTKKTLMTLLLAAGMLLGVQGNAQAIDFKVQGLWQVGFGLGDATFTESVSGRKSTSNDNFSAMQRLRLKVDAVASEALSGTVYFEIGVQDWGNAGNGGALGSDATNRNKIKQAYLDWSVPNTDLKLRMGLQGIALPSAAGGSAILDSDLAGVVANYAFNENVGLTALWMRPANDNFVGRDGTSYQANYLDNLDLFALTLPLTFDGVSITPWAMYGMMGTNTLDGYNGLGRHTTGDEWYTVDGTLESTLLNFHPGFAANSTSFGTSPAYTSMFWFGLPITLTLWDPLNIEFEFNYGYSGGMGSYDLMKRGMGGTTIRADSRREGWLVKALVEYKFSWGVPGIFGWYASGDNGDMKNGSGRLPTVAGAGYFTSFMGCDGIDMWADGTRGFFYEKNLTYAGTWGVGLQVRDVSFLEDLSHTFRVALWGGTNSPSMVKYFDDRQSAWAGNDGYYSYDGPYLTTHDNLLEFNLDNTWKAYENLAVKLDLGYIVNMYDTGTWNRSWMQDSKVEKKDAWKAQLMFEYSF
ncbi:MAG: outer membrane homotrimeric porin [Desulfovibrio sp.]|nr:outer membrane homotrimeric porin [Desulfovibrio sp.]